MAQAKDSEPDTYEMLNLFGEVFDRVKEDYVEEVTDEKLIESALNGMLSALDPHSSYLSNKDFEEMQVQTKGEFGGLGIEVTMENGLVKVVSPIDDTPAFKADVHAGDYISHIDDVQVMGLALSEAVEKMRGAVGSKIHLTILREGETEPLEKTIVRDIIKIQTAKTRLEGEDIGYIRLTSFSEQTASKMREGIVEIEKKAGKNLKGYVLDMRNNPGGLLDQAIEVSDTFLEQGEIVSTKGRHEQDSKRYNATEGDLTDGKIIVVLINGGSASAAEIVAGALQDHNRAVVMGTKSFGKGSVQTVIPLIGHGAMRLTTSRYYTPSGRSIQAEGIEPDIEVKQAKVEYEKPNKFMSNENDLAGHLENDAKVKQKKSVIKFPEPKDGDKKDSEIEDFQLSRAIDLIHGAEIFGKLGKVTRH
jgi:carboxyl-terminal processing protease